jgi:hypothetical protein
MSIYDRASKLGIALEDMWAAVFKLTPSKKVALRVSTDADDPLNVNIAGSDADTPTPRLIDAANAGTKYNFTFTAGAQSFLIKAADDKITKVSYAYSEADYDAGKFFTITSGGFLTFNGLKIKEAQNFYFKCDKNNVKLEVTEWT